AFGGFGGRGGSVDPPPVLVNPSFDIGRHPVWRPGGLERLDEPPILLGGSGVFVAEDVLHHVPGKLNRLVLLPSSVAVGGDVVVYVDVGGEGKAGRRPHTLRIDAVLVRDDHAAVDLTHPQAFVPRLRIVHVVLQVPAAAARV